MTVARKNQIKPPKSPDIRNAVGRVTIPGPRVLISRFIVVDLTPPGFTSFFDFLGVSEESEFDVAASFADIRPVYRFLGPDST